MQTIIKRIAFILALLLALSLSSAAFAATPEPAAEDPAAIEDIDPISATLDPEDPAIADEDNADGTDSEDLTPEDDTLYPEDLDEAYPDGEDSPDTETDNSGAIGTVRTAIIYVLLVTSLALIVLVLIQQTKSSGLGGAYGSDTASFTVRGKAASREAKLQKLTVAAAITIGVLSIILTIID